jgi:hypothetical protein
MKVVDGASQSLGGPIWRQFPQSVLIFLAIPTRPAPAPGRVQSRYRRGAQVKPNETTPLAGGPGGMTISPVVLER